MRLLLDTHIWIWSHLDPGKLSSTVTASLLDGKNELWLSPISIWELLVLVLKGRIRLSIDVGAWISEAMKRAPMNEAPITYDVALATSDVQLQHNDPADRFLAATALVYDLTLVTADQRLIAAQGLSTLSNR